MKWVSLTLLVGLAFALSACQAAQPRRPTVEGRFDIGGTSLYLLCFDARPGPDATPTVLLEHGIGRRATSEMWVAVNIKWRPLPACVAMIVPVSGRVTRRSIHTVPAPRWLKSCTSCSPSLILPAPICWLGIPSVVIPSGSMRIITPKR